MEDSTVVWVVIGILVLLALIAAAVMASRKSKERNLEKQRSEAHSIRQEASEHSATTVRRQEAEAAEMEAHDAADILPFLATTAARSDFVDA